MRPDRAIPSSMQVRLALVVAAAAAVALVGVMLGRGPAVQRPAVAHTTALETFVAVAQPGTCERPDAFPAMTIGCTRDGSRILIQKDDLNLFVLRADGAY